MNCPHCNDTGDMLGDGDLDCFYCDAAEILAKNGAPAFPCRTLKHAPGEVGNSHPIYAEHAGLSVRDYFAAKAMQGLLANSNLDDLFASGDFKSVVKQIADNSYQYADAMLRTRSA